MQSVLMQVDEVTTVGDVLAAACGRRQLSVDQHFILLKSSVDARDVGTVPDCRSPLLTQVTNIICLPEWSCTHGQPRLDFSHISRTILTIVFFTRLAKNRNLVRKT